jgi:alpha-tubulin suppressor-like RCC1 family protein
MKKISSKKFFYIFFMTTFAYIFTVFMNYPGIQAADATMVANWKFNQSTGTTVSDSSGKSNTGTINGTPNWVPGVEGNSLEFNGVNNYVTCSNSTSLNVKGNISIEAWIKTTSYEVQICAKYGGGANPPGYALRIMNGRLSFWCGPSNGTWYSSTGLVNDGNWHYVAVTGDGTNGAFYIDGKPSGNFPFTAIRDNAGSKLYLGCYEGMGCFLGKLDEVTLWNRALTATEISSHYQALIQYFPAIAISAGDNQSYMLRADGTLWGCGYSLYGIGDGTGIGHSLPLQVINLNNVSQVAAGWSYAVALKSDGTIWAWGGNLFGQLGDGTKTARTSPVQVSVLTNNDIIAVAALYSHSMALKNDGTVWAWGFNDLGKLGNGTVNNTTTPVQVIQTDGSPFTGIIAISAGQSCSLALKSNGTVWAWGSNSNGELGDPSRSWSSYPVQVVQSNGQPLTGVIAISAGDRYALALKNDGTVWAWGYNYYGQLGDGTATQRKNPVQVIQSNGQPLTGITSIAAGVSHNLALKDDGTVWTWGANDYGQLGNGNTTGSYYPVQVIRSNGQPFTGVAAISTGIFHSMARKSDGTVWIWGYNIRGQLGDNTTVNSATPVQTL